MQIRQEPEALRDLVISRVGLIIIILMILGCRYSGPLSSEGSVLVTLLNKGPRGFFKPALLPSNTNREGDLLDPENQREPYISLVF
jgi:hypothetical protein